MCVCMSVFARACRMIAAFACRMNAAFACRMNAAFACRMNAAFACRVSRIPEPMQHIQTEQPQRTELVDAIDTCKTTGLMLRRLVVTYIKLKFGILQVRQ